MVEATAMVYKVMEEQHKVDSLVPKEPTILKDAMCLNEFALQLCCTHGIPEHDTNGHPGNIFEMNTSIATISVQCSDENSLYLEGKRVKPQCFSCHVDDKNDPEYCDVWVIYKHVQDPNSHLWFCVGNVFTYHKSCGDYMQMTFAIQFQTRKTGAHLSRDFAGPTSDQSFVTTIPLDALSMH